VSRFSTLSWPDVELLAETLSRVDVSVIAADTAGTVKVWNPAAEHLYGWSAQEVLGLSIMSLTVGPSEQQTATDIMSTVSAGAVWEGDFVATTRSGAHAEVHVVDAPIFGGDGGIEGVVGLSSLSRHAAQAAIVEMAELIEYHRVGVQAVERDRQRIARELHDELGQFLTALRTEVLWMHSKSDGELADAASRAEGSVSAALDSLRRVVDELHPRLLEQLGVCSAVESMADSFGVRLGLAAHVDIDHAALGWIQNDVEIAVFRVTQECLTNVERHAKGATSVTVEMTRVRDSEVGSDEFVLRVVNDGVPYGGDRGYGIRGMMDRAAAVGGKVNVTSTATGTVVEMRVPSAIAFTDRPANVHSVAHE
jgi:PAS domain S-box-containing protein